MRLFATLLILTAFGTSLAAAVARAGEKSVAEEILDILRASHQIDQRQYEDLLEKARSERTGAQAAPQDPRTFRVYWKNGIRLDTRDGAFKLKIGGRLQNDWAVFQEDSGVGRSIGQLGNGTEFRRARLYVAGTLYDRLKFKAQYDFAGGQTKLKDAYIELTRLPGVGHLRVGHFKEPYGLEELTSSKYLTFQERSIGNFAPSRNTGIMIFDSVLEKRLTWAAGGFYGTNDFASSDTTEGNDKQFNATARLTALPWYRDQGARLLHLGLSYSHKFRTRDMLRFRKRPEAHLAAHRLVDTGNVLVDGADLVTPEVALVWGPFSIQAEYTRIFLDAVGMRNSDFEGYYVQASYFLTGEHRRYAPAHGAFSRVSPITDFTLGGGPGAWELAVRYSRIDLDDAGVSGGRLGDLAVGVNWHLNPNVRLMLDYVHSRLASTGDVNLAEGRFQVDF
ncbi:MAG: OprO/OprP family phosphate-selective porin [Myxococcota bacterium]